MVLGKASRQAEIIIRALTEAVRALVDFKGFYIVVLFISLLYLIPNSSLIGASKDLVYSYSILIVLGMVWALILDTQARERNQRGKAADGDAYAEEPLILDKLGWRAQNPLRGKYIQSPQKSYTIILTATLAAVCTAIVVYQIWPPGESGSDLMPSVRLEIAFQQLLLVTLPETVLFTGLLPLILMRVLYDREDIRNDRLETAHWAIIYIVSQAAFAAVHYKAYGGDFTAMFRVFLLGCAWLFMARRFGLGAAWGSHFGYNCAALSLIVIGG